MFGGLIVLMGLHIEEIPCFTRYVVAHPLFQYLRLFLQCLDLWFSPDQRQIAFFHRGDESTVFCLARKVLQRLFRISPQEFLLAFLVVLPGEQAALAATRNPYPVARTPLSMRNERKSASLQGFVFCFSFLKSSAGEAASSSVLMRLSQWHLLCGGCAGKIAHFHMKQEA